MKKILFIFVALLMLGSVAYATSYSGQLGDAWSVESESDGGSIIPDTTSQNIGSAAYPVDIVYANTVTMTTANVGHVRLPLIGMLISGVTSPTASTQPGLEVDNLLPELNWADGETTPVQVSFRVPSDYLSGGAFRLFCDSSNSTTPEQVDFSVYVNKNNTAWDAAATDQTPVALARAAGTPEQVTLTVATDFATLAAGDIVTLNLWRDNVSTGTGDLELYSCEFYYNRK